MKFQAVIFDFDGTVADTAEGIFECAQYAVRVLGEKALDRETLVKFIGPPLRYSFEEYAGLEAEKAEKAVELYRENYSAGGLFKLRFYDGLLDLVRELKAKGIKVGIASAKPDVFIQRILEKYQIRELFDHAQGISLADYCTDKTDVIRKVIETIGVQCDSDVLMVGDTLFDIQGAKSVGVSSAGVLYGYGDNEEMLESGADYIVPTIAELRSVIFN